MEGSRRTQAAVLVAIAAGVVWAVASSVDGWADWVVLAAIVAVIAGGAIAVNPRSYPTKKRTFVRDYDDPGGPR